MEVSTSLWIPPSSHMVHIIFVMTRVGPPFYTTKKGAKWGMRMKGL